MPPVQLSHPLITAAVLLAAVPALLALQTACQAVDPGEMPHTAFTPTGPKHSSVAGVLTGAHAELACEGCHVGQESPYGKVADDCIGCHDDTRIEKAGPNHYPDALTCSGDTSCHRVVDYCWNWATDTPDQDCRQGLPSSTAPTDTDPTLTDTDTPDTGTDTPTTTDTGTPPTGNSCAIAGCHGDGPVRDDAAPSTSSHNAHLGANSDLWAPANPITCDTCHPAGAAGAKTYDVATHEDGTIDVPMAGIDVGDNPSPTYSGGTCSGTYCHGAGLADPPVDPTWDGGGGQVACGTTCHGLPPDQMYQGGAVTNHPGLDGCGTCHEPTAALNAPPDQLADLSTHIDGTVDAN